MLLDFRQPGELVLPATAVVIVGSGAAGLALALTLGDRRRPVVLVESGGDLGDAQAATAAATLNSGTVEGLPFRLSMGRARVLGGTTQLWHGQCMRLHDIDLRTRPWVPYSGWPIGVDCLTRHYAAAERWLGLSGEGYGEERWPERPGLARIPWDSRHVLDDFTEYVRRPQLGGVHRGRLRRDRWVAVVVNATVSRVLVDGGRAVGVEVLGAGRRRAVLQASQVVLAAGGIENARLLQLSDPDGVGLGDGRENTGRYLQTHPVIHTAELRPRDHAVLQDRYVALHRRGRRLFPKVRLAPQAQQAHRLLDANAVFAHEFNAGQEAIRRTLRARALARLRAGDLRWLGRDVYRRYARGLPTGRPPSRVRLEVWLEQAPDPDSRVMLDSSTDDLGLRRARVRWRCNEPEIRTSRSFTRWIAADLRRLGIAEVTELPVMQDDAAWRSAVGDAFHPAGTTRMSTWPQSGVVGPDLRVHGVGGLYVVGGSVFPTSGYANPTLTIVALALRLADELAPAPNNPGGHRETT